MSFCQKCGNEIANDAQFCPKCGATVGNAENTSSPAAPTQPNVPKKSNKGLIGIIAAVAVVAVVAIIAVVVILGGKSKNNVAPANDAPITQEAENINADDTEAATQNAETPAPQTNTAANWYDFVFVEGNQSIDLPCTLRAFVDAMVTSGKSDVEADLNSVDANDLKDFYKFDMSSENYKDIDLSYEVRVYKNGATNIWDYTVCAITVKGNQTKTYPDVNLQPGIYIGMSETDMLNLVGTPNNKNETSGGKTAYLFENGDYELEVDCDENGRVYWFSCEYNIW